MPGCGTKTAGTQLRFRIQKTQSKSPRCAGRETQTSLAGAERLPKQQAPAQTAQGLTLLAHRNPMFSASPFGPTGLLRSLSRLHKYS